MFYDSTTCIFFGILVLLYILIVIYKKGAIRRGISTYQTEYQKRKRTKKEMVLSAIRSLIHFKKAFKKESSYIYNEIPIHLPL